MPLKPRLKDMEKNNKKTYQHMFKTLNEIGFDKRKHDLVLVIDRFFFVVVAFVKSFSMVVMLAY